MGAYELTLPETPPTTNPRTGQFRKGHIPFNKGKRWSDYMSKSGRRRAKKGWKNVEIYRKKGACAGWNRQAVVAITEDGVFAGRFDSAVEAARQSEAERSNICNCCKYKRKYAGKTIDGRRLRWFYETDDTWIDFLKEKQ
ncbi:MAG: hypothetical protein LBJ63_07670 [Prevotellaceae bacterium]|jgi:hypothetical protein|nr:hypothetical protein [Prevotellaceae bacterium]